MKSGYIAFFDSGMGGVSVLAAAKKMLPEEDFIYLGDVANAPYGDKSTEEVRAMVLESLNILHPWGLKALVVACNTATSVSIIQLRERLQIPVLGMEPALKPAVRDSIGSVVVLGTSLTLKEEKFHNLMEKMGTAKEIIPLSCPGLVELIEKDPQMPEIGEYLRNILLPYRENMGGIVLGCTHYVFLRPWLKTLLPEVQVFDGNEGVCRQLQKILTTQELLGGGTGQIIWLSSLKKEKNEIFMDKCWDFYDFYNSMIG